MRMRMQTYSKYATPSYGTRLHRLPNHKPSAFHWKLPRSQSATPCRPPTTGDFHLHSGANSLTLGPRPPVRFKSLQLEILGTDLGWETKTLLQKRGIWYRQRQPSSGNAITSNATSSGKNEIFPYFHPSLSCGWLLGLPRDFPCNRFAWKNFFISGTTPDRLDFPVCCNYCSTSTATHFLCFATETTTDMNVTPCFFTWTLVCLRRVRLVASNFFQLQRYPLAANVPCTYFTQGTHSMNWLIHQHYHTVDLPTTCQLAFFNASLVDRSGQGMPVQIWVRFTWWAHDVSHHCLDIALICTLFTFRCLFLWLARLIGHDCQTLHLSTIHLCCDAGALFSTDIQLLIVVTQATLTPLRLELLRNLHPPPWPGDIRPEPTSPDGCNDPDQFTQTTCKSVSWV